MSRVVGGGGVTNTAVTKDEKRAGYSPKKFIELENNNRTQSPLKTHLQSPNYNTNGELKEQNSCETLKFRSIHMMDEEELKLN